MKSDMERQKLAQLFRLPFSHTHFAVVFEMLKRKHRAKCLLNGPGHRKIIDCDVTYLALRVNYVSGTQWAVFRGQHHPVSLGDGLGKVGQQRERQRTKTAGFGILFDP